MCISRRCNQCCGLLSIGLGVFDDHSGLRPFKSIQRLIDFFSTHRDGVLKCVLGEQLVVDSSNFEVLSLPETARHTSEVGML